VTPEDAMPCISVTTSGNAVFENAVPEVVTPGDAKHCVSTKIITDTNSGADDSRDAMPCVSVTTSGNAVFRNAVPEDATPGDAKHCVSTKITANAYYEFADVGNVG